jgi:hypothetical protein
MLRFRPLPPPSPDHTPPSPKAIRSLLAEVLLPGHFFQAGSTCLEWQAAVHEESAWEIFRGRLLDPAHTRQRQSFLSWNVYLRTAAGRSDEPLLSVKLDEAGRQLHVTRSLHCHAWEGYHAGEDVYLSRQTQKWVRELVGTVSLDRFADIDTLRDEVICLLFRAVVGTSRLPLTSLEAPLPGFSLGELAYFHRPHLPAAAARTPLQSPAGLIDLALGAHLSRLEQVKWLETFLRAVPPTDLPGAVERLVGRWRELGRQTDEFVPLLCELFNEVSLSPWTDFADKVLAFLGVLEERGLLAPAAVVDGPGRLLRQLGRHLGAYDLIQFHHQGANYPDALLLDALLGAYLERAERHPGLFEESPADSDAVVRQKRLRRRALRQGCLLRCRYEGHLVPDAPTSPGENARVLPAPLVRVPEEQILQPHRRQRRLFADRPLAPRLQGRLRQLLRRSCEDLDHPEELRELGTALFLDRPLGAGKPPAAPDQTPLFSYVAFSPSLARRRLEELAHLFDWLDTTRFAALARRLGEGPAAGLPVAALFPGGSVSPSRPGTVSLADVLRVADDFLLLASTRRTVAAFCDLFDLQRLQTRLSLDYLSRERRVLLVGSGNAEAVRLTVYDAVWRRRLELTFDPRQGYESRGGVEYPAAGLRVTGAWDEDGTPHAGLDALPQLSSRAERCPVEGEP